MTKIEWTDETWNPTRGCSMAPGSELGGCLNCLSPDTSILYQDMLWRPIGEAKVGDALFAFDEYAPTKGHFRKFRPARVQAVWVTRKPTVRLITARAEITTTPNHRWLGVQNAGRWTPTSGLNIGRTLRHVGKFMAPVETSDYRYGYLAGMTLGDGTFRYEPGQRSDKCGFKQAYWRVALSEKDDAALGRLLRYLAALGISANIRPFSEPKLNAPGFGFAGRISKVEIRALGALSILHPILTREIDSQEYRRGFVAGFFDAEGSGSDNFRVGQNDKLVLERFSGYAKALGFNFEIETPSTSQPTARLLGGLSARVGFFAMFQPALLRKAGLLGYSMQFDADPVVCVEPGPIMDVIDIQTSTGTFYAEGIATHNCYAARNQLRRPQQTAASGKPFAILRDSGPRWSGEVELIESKLLEPLHWRAPRRVFVNSMSDLWHESLLRVEQARVYAIMAYCQAHDFQVLTKRPEVHYRYCGLEDDVRELLQVLLQRHGPPPHAKPFRWPLPNVWEGVSVENQATADARIPELLKTPAALRFFSYEPALAPVDFREWLTPGPTRNGRGGYSGRQAGTEPLDWGIVGGESGPQARPCNLAWIDSTVDQFAAAGRPLFVKQVGSKPVQTAPNCLQTRYPITDSKGGNWNEWPAKLRVREFPR
jgi:protein gp37